jgi:osmotically-inducible protein OsmY
MLGVDVRRPTADVHTGEIPSCPERQLTEAAAESTLRQSPYGELNSVSCHFHEGVLTLRGAVRSYYLKQVAQTLVRSIEGVEQICNRLHVVASDNGG